MRRTAMWLALFVLAAPPTVAGDAAGFIYGLVVTKGGASHEGRLRWNDEEAFWGDLFHASKPLEARPHVDRAPADAHRKPIKVFGLTVGFHSENDGSRQLVVRFGDLAMIRPRGSEGAILTFRSGAEYEVEGGSNDLGANIQVNAANSDAIEIPWETIERIEFKAAPSKLSVSEHRLHGTVVTRAGSFRGFIQWDQQETLSTDKLDGEDGEHKKVVLELGSIRSIEPSDDGSRVTLRNGETLELDGTNDVNDENRGIYVEDERFGRVLVAWEACQRVDFSEPGPSGMAYSAFTMKGPLTGRVTATDGAKHSGKIAYDLDESEAWELLDGHADGIDYSIPMGMIAAIAHEGERARVVLRSGAELELGGTADVGEGNDGVAIDEGDGKVAYVAWNQVKRVDFD